MRVELAYLATCFFTSREICSFTEHLQKNSEVLSCDCKNRFTFLQMKHFHGAHERATLSLRMRVTLRLIWHIIYFALFSNKRAWVARQIDASRRLRRRWAEASEHKAATAPELSLDAPRASWLGHSTCWVQWQGLSILTDPIWSRRCSPVSFFGPVRLQPIPISLDNLQRPSLVLISHNHFDHLDLPSLRKIARLSPKTRFVAPAGLGEWLIAKGIPAHSLELGQSLKCTIMDCKITLTCTPAIHYSQRNLWDRNRTKWSSWVGELQRGGEKKTFYFAGDTAYDDAIFKTIGQKFDIDLSFVPIGAYEPRILLRNAHVNPEEAIAIHREVKSKLSIACHHSTFMLGDPFLEHPLEDLAQAIEKSAVPPKSFIALEVGQSVNW